jgi:hypothetical protein
MSRVIQHLFRDETTVGAVSNILDNLGADLCHLVVTGKGTVTAGAVIEGAIDTESAVWQKLTEVTAPSDNTSTQDAVRSAKRFDSLGFQYIRTRLVSISGNGTSIDLSIAGITA